ncbi:hypothetical protein [Aeromonas phage phiWae14]|nr:hypothetical protein [Aeromonas phage phiWae14]
MLDTINVVQVVDRMECELAFQKAYDWHNLTDDQQFMVRGACWTTWVMGWNAARQVPKHSLTTAFCDVLRNSLIAKERTVHEVLGKCTEELGEMSTVINKPKKQHPEPLHAEFADLIIAGLDVVYMHLVQQKGMPANETTARTVINLVSQSIVEKNEKWHKQIVS